MHESTYKSRLKSQFFFKVADGTREVKNECFRLNSNLQIELNELLLLNVHFRDIESQ